jgi:hypothetical protein
MVLDGLKASEGRTELPALFHVAYGHFDHPLQASQHFGTFQRNDLGQDSTDIGRPLSYGADDAI